MDVITIETPSLGDRSYVVHDGSAAAVIDPQRDLDRLLAEVERLGLAVVAVFETHIHNDYVSGGLELARRTGASYHVAAADEVDFDRVPARDGDVVAVGSFALRAVHTPGHTPTHLSWVVVEGGDDLAVCSGGSMLYGSVGRTDLVEDVDTEEQTRLQYRSVRGLADDLPGAADVLPTHGFGSFCSSGDTVERSSSTIDREREDNDALVQDDEDTFVRELLAGLDAYPDYYAHMGPRNREGASAIDLSPAPKVDAREVRRRIDAGEWVVDLRSREAFAADHVTGTINVEYSDSATTYLGWLLPWGTPVTLVADDLDTISAMQRDLARIGVDRPAGCALFSELVDADMARASLPRDDFDGLEQAGDVTVLDVRRNGERKGGALAGSLHVPLHELEARMDEVPTDEVLWVHCASGYRASIATSLLARAGRDVVLVDGDFRD